MDQIFKVHGLDHFRMIVEKNLIYKDDGVWLESENDSVHLETDIDVWKKQYTPENPIGGYFTAFFHLTNDCNKNCRYCYEKTLPIKHPGNNTLEEFIYSIQKYVPDDPRGYGERPYKEYKYDGYHPVIRFVGGEPTMFPDLDKLVHWIVENTNNKIHIYTNGIKLLDDDYLKRFPNSNQINWALSVDHETDPAFIRTITENIIDNNSNHEYSYGVLLSCPTAKKMLEVDKICREYNPQEIRYRGISDQLHGKFFPKLSQLIQFICKSRGLDKDYYLENARFHQQCLSCLSYDKTDNPDTGNIVTAILPLWRTMIVEDMVKYGSFVINTKFLNHSCETHAVSGALYKWRMSIKDITYHPGLEPIWGKVNDIFVKEKHYDYNKEY